MYKNTALFSIKVSESLFRIDWKSDYHIWETKLLARLSFFLLQQKPKYLFKSENKCLCHSCWSFDSRLFTISTELLSKYFFEISFCHGWWSCVELEDNCCNWLEKLRITCRIKHVKTNKFDVMFRLFSSTF